MQTRQTLRRRRCDARRKRRLLSTTDTLEQAIAALAIIGDGNQPGHAQASDGHLQVRSIFLNVRPHQFRCRIAGQNGQ